jgi:DnaJ-class molecular chaperone
MDIRKKILSYCTILGVRNFPTKKEIKEAKYKQLKIYHPDVW